ncbi:hypothetical protein PR002_g22342 [Phytophthora rubi]|uniref:RNA-directed DNA polymerase n=1 Tax=Phytophthora rubi TaxID=129364 RepID=A0A6A3ITW7_9STRA|nr:hypothetical protein PR002_g22342 [Phytophthora rubi]
MVVVDRAKRAEPVVWNPMTGRPRRDPGEGSVGPEREGSRASKSKTVSWDAPLFTDDELDALEAGEVGQEESVLAGTEVTAEAEEYEKELEDRMYPLDEIELKRRVEANAKAQEEPSLEELSLFLSIPKEVLERTKGAALDSSRTPEYWQKWFEDKLETSEEAKRAHRDFRDAVVNVVRCASAGPSRGGEGNEDRAKMGKRSDSATPRGDSADETGSPPAAESLAATSLGGSPIRGGEAVFPAAELSSPPSPAGLTPRPLRTVARQAVFEALKEARCGLDPPNDSSVLPEGGRTPTAGSPSTDAAPEFDETGLRERVDLILSRLGLSSRKGERVVPWLRSYFKLNAASVWTKLRERTGRSKTASARRRRRRRSGKKGVVNVSVLFKPYAEVLRNVEFYPEQDEDVSHYVEVVRNNRPARTVVPKTGLVEVVTVNMPDGFGVRTEGEEDCEVPRVVKDGRRVVCSVGNFEALSSGYIDCLPSQMLADTGATLSLVDRRVLKRLGRSSEPLEPYEGLVRSSSGHKLRIHGWMTLTLRLGTVEIPLSVLVAGQLHVDAILGVDALGAFGAVIDVAERSMKLKPSGEVLPLGFTVTQDSYMATMATSIRLPPRGQALVMSRVQGDVADCATVLLEGSLDLPPNLCVARSLGSVEDGQVIVEICNASTDEYWIRRGTVVACASVIPESAFETPPRTPTGSDSSVPHDTGPERAATVTDVRRGEESRPAEAPPDKAPPPTKKTDFRSMFVESSKKPGRTDLLQFEIDTGDSAPIKQQPYRVSLAEGEVMEAEIQQYLGLNLIRPSTSAWASPVLMIRKPDGGIRFCIDYRKLNAVTVKDCYPMPLIDDILDVLGDAQLFSTMDIASGYWNVPMHPDSVSRTAFTCKYGLYEWLVMPFGLCNAVPAFERLMETVLADLKWRTRLVDLDDCVIFSKDFPTHLVRVRQVLTRLQQAGFKLKMKKCHWGRSQVAFLGHIVTPTGILPNPEKVKSVLNVKRPVDVHGIRSFLGLTSYFRRYIPGYAAISAPLERLKAKDAPFDWNEDCEGAFRQLKRALLKPPILVYPDGKRRFKLYVDSSRYAVGACLMQEVEGRDRVVAYASKLLTGSQKNWINNQDGISEIECWGVVWATRKFRCYLDKREFDLFTDHQALTWVFSPGNRTTNAKLARWAMELSSLQFKVHHRPGTSMGHVDGLSRLPTDTVAALTMRDLLNPEAADSGTFSSSVGEQDGEVPIPTTGGEGGEYADGHVDESDPGLPNEDVGASPDDAPRPSPVDQFGLDFELFVRAQQDVPWIKALVAFLLDGALPLDPFLWATVLRMQSRYEVREGLLLRRVHLPARVGPARSLTVPVVPLQYVETVLHYCHSDILSSHLGLTKTLEKARRHAFWPGWRKDVAEYVRECARCGGGKGSRPWRAGQMQRMPVADLTGPFSLLVVDAVGPLPETERGNKYILVFVVYFTRWAEAFAAKKLDSVTFVEAMVNGVVAQHGVPSRLLSDNG